MRSAIAGAVAALVLAAACDASAGDADASLRVLAAASLTEALTDVAADYESQSSERPDVDLQFAGSSALARQIVDGADADVFISADEQTMAKVVDASGAEDPVVFARNRLVIIVADGNPAGVRSIDDLGRRNVTLVVCAPTVPCGRLAAAMFARAGVDAAPASLEENVKGVVAKVALGEADAGIVYATDAKTAARSTQSIDVPVATEDELQARYVAATVSGSDHREAASDFVEYLQSERAQDVFRAAGFLTGRDG